MEDEQQSREANKVCGVCGDRALGYNFNAVSCESCKAFFRRNALKNKDFRCPFTENCTITQITRRFCQKCRLDKCFSIGMRKEYIMSEEDKVLKRKKIEQNRAKKRPTLETQKLLKMKRESVEDCNFDNDTSVSVTSVASTVSETYFWESDKKYADLDGNRQQLVDNMSPVAAASVPSPSSPPENADIAGSKTLDMLKEPSLRIDTFEISVDENYKGELSLVDRIETEEFDEQWGDRSKCMEKCDTLENDPLSVEEPPSVSPKCTVRSERGPMQREPSEDFECEKQFGPKNRNDKRNSEKESQHLPNLVPRLLNNPKALTRILQDENVIMKIMSDPEIIKRLVSDPQVSSILEESSPSREDEPKEVEFQDTARSSGGPLGDRIEPVSNVEDSRVNNPILTNLIIDCSSKECKNQNRVLEDDHLGECSKSTEDVTKDVLQEVQRIPMAGDSIESILSAAIKLEFSAYSSLGGNRNSRELNDAERAKLNELIVANKALLAPLDDDITNLVGEDCPFKGTSGQSDPALLDVINLTAIAIRRIIKMAKRINAFKNMCQDDQLALLKGGCTELLILRAATTYDPDKNMWKIPHTQERMSKIKVDILKEVKGNLYSEHAKFVRTFDPRWRDENIILILSAIALFTPDRPKVVHSDVIKLEQTSYYYLLRRYLESVYPGCEAKSTFLKLIQKISELHRFNHEVVGVYLNVNPSSVEPLLIEIFDLKH